MVSDWLPFSALINSPLPSTCVTGKPTSYSQSALHMGPLMFPAGISCTAVGPKWFKFNYLDTLLSAVTSLLFSL